MMSELRPVTRTRHGNQRWLRVAGYPFAAKDAAAPLVSHEMQRAVLALPTGFVQQEGGFALVAVQGFVPGRNLFVAADGRWLGGYIPAVYRSYPFQFAKTEDGRGVLCVDEGSGLLTQDTSQGEPFFDDEGKLAKPVGEIMEFLSQLRAARFETERACAALKEHNLLRPWQIQLKSDAGEPRKVQGLFRVDEAALNALPATGLTALRDAGALKLAYAQLLSMQHLPMLAKLAQGQAQSAAAQGLRVTPDGDLDLEFLNKGGTISFGNLG
jgi:hypothetical protein